MRHEVLIEFRLLQNLTHGRVIEVRCDRFWHLRKDIRGRRNDRRIRFEKDGVHLVEGVARFVMHRPVRRIVDPQIKGAAPESAGTPCKCRR